MAYVDKNQSEQGKKNINYYRVTWIICESNWDITKNEWSSMILNANWLKMLISEKCWRYKN